MLFENKEIEIVFENSECLRVIASVEFDIVTIEDDIVEFIDNVNITIPTSCNGVYHAFGDMNRETTIFNKLANSDDITQIIIDGNTYYPKWYEQDEYSWSTSNEYQNTYKTEDGTLVVDISVDNKVFVDETQNLIEVLSDFMRENPLMSFGKIVHAIECKIGSSVIGARNETIIAMLEELMMEAI